MTSATIGGTSTTFSYNGDGLRESLTIGGNTTTFTWDVASSIPQVLDDGTLRYIYGIGRIAQVESDDTAHYFLADGLSSTMALTDDVGAVENSDSDDDCRRIVLGSAIADLGIEGVWHKFAVVRPAKQKKQAEY